MNTVEITDDNFQTITSGEKPVLIDFWATWCGPCKVMIPIIDELAEEFEDRAVIGKMDVEKNTTPRKLGIRSIPTLIIFKNGEMINRHLGAASKEYLSKHIEELIA